jgi:endonuclease YncB( thermonuclease family)
MRRCVSVLIAAFAVMSQSRATQPTVSHEPSRSRDAGHAVDVHAAPDSSDPIRKKTDSLDAELTWVMDGDSLRARIAGEQVEVRLADIDAPEHGQRYAWQAKLALIDLVRDKRLTVVPREIDRHGRMVARVSVGETDVSRELVNQGAAWFYPAYAKDRALYDLEQQARTAKRGLWSIEGPRVAPWAWRQSHPTFQRDTPLADDEPQLRRGGP